MHVHMCVGGAGSLYLSVTPCKTRITMHALLSHRNAQGGSLEVHGYEGALSSEKVVRIQCSD